MNNKLKALLYTILIAVGVAAFLGLAVQYVEYALPLFGILFLSLMLVELYNEIFDNLNKNKKS